MNTCYQTENVFILMCEVFLYVMYWLIVSGVRPKAKG